LRYQTLNQAPELTNLEVPDLDTKDLDNPKKLKSAGPPAIRTTTS